MNKEKEELEKWKRLYTSLTKANVKLQEAVISLQKQLTITQAYLDSASKAADLNKDLLHKMTAERDKKDQELIDKINRLENKLRELGYADFDNMGN